MPRVPTLRFESGVWPEGRHCAECGSLQRREAGHARMPCWGPECRSCFSVRTRTAMHRSKVPLRKRAITIHPLLTSLKSVSSMKLHRDIGVSQPTARFMSHRNRTSQTCVLRIGLPIPPSCGLSPLSGRRSGGAELRPEDKPAAEIHASPKSGIFDAQSHIERPCLPDMFVTPEHRLGDGLEEGFPGAQGEMVRRHRERAEPPGLQARCGRIHAFRRLRGAGATARCDPGPGGGGSVAAGLGGSGERGPAFPLPGRYAHAGRGTRPGPPVPLPALPVQARGSRGSGS